MNGTEIITFLSNNLDTISSAVGPVAGALFTAIFLRHNTKTDEFEKIKTGQFKEVADDLLACLLYTSCILLLHLQDKYARFPVFLLS